MYIYIFSIAECIYIVPRCFYIYGAEMFVHFAVTRSQANRRVDKAIACLSLETTAADEGGSRRRRQPPRRFTAGDADSSNSDSDDGMPEMPAPKKRRSSQVQAEEAPGPSNKPSLPTPPHISSEVFMIKAYIATTTSTSIYQFIRTIYIYTY